MSRVNYPRRKTLGVLGALSSLALAPGMATAKESPRTKPRLTNTTLPAPEYTGNISINSALRHRQSIRSYQDTTLTKSDLAQMLFAAQGETPRDGWMGKTAPSAGALYPIEVYVAIFNVSGLSKGLYRYISSTHSLEQLKEGDLKSELYACGYGEPEAINESAFSIIITGVLERIEKKYGDRDARYTYIESGAVVQNIYLQAQPLNLATVCIGGIDDARTLDFLDEGRFNLQPIAIMPIGRAHESYSSADITQSLDEMSVQNLDEGWHMLGSSVPIEDGSALEGSKYAWRHGSEGWIGYGPGEFHSFSTDAYEGFWLRR